MIKNHIKIAIRNLERNKSYAFISISGLAIGMAVCILLLFYVQHELSYDRFHANADHIYRLCQPEHPYQAPQTAKLLADNLPEIKNYARILVHGELKVQYGEKRFKETEFVFADASLFQIFSFQFSHGNPETALLQPFSLVISEKIALKYFGDENPIGRVMRLSNTDDYTVTGVMENMPQNSHFRYDFFASLTNADAVFSVESMNNWNWQNFLVYFYIPHGFSKSALETRCNELIAKHRNSGPNNPRPKYSIQHLKDIHLYSSHFDSDIQPQNSIIYVLVFSGIGALILFIACFNHINLLTANATTRTKEIGIKKAVGATRKQLAMQFMGESFVVLLFAFSLTLILVEICLPLFNQLSGKALSFAALPHVKTILGVIGITFITGLLAGCYPAFFLSALHPVNALKATKSGGKSKFNFRRLLVGAQFTIVIILISSAILMFRQIDFLQKKELGFDKEYTLISDVDSFEKIEKYNALKQALLEQNLVTSVSCGSRVPSGSLNNRAPLLPEGQSEYTMTPYVHVGFDYFETLGITASQGRLFSKELESDVEEAIILNEAAVNNLGILGNPVGQSIQCYWPYSSRRIVGIVSDFHFESLYEKIRPTAFVVHYNQCRQLMVKIKPSNAISSINTIKEVCQRFYPEWIFGFHLLDDRLEQIYQKDKRAFHLMGGLTTLAIFIACMGLFGLSSFMLTRRIKEIGMRKILGASFAHIMVVLTKDFAKWLLMANVVALPVAWYAMDRWLQNFAYQTEIAWWVFLVAGGAALVIALTTVSFQAIRAALANPVNTLRHE